MTVTERSVSHHILTRYSDFVSSSKKLNGKLYTKMTGHKTLITDLNDILFLTDYLTKLYVQTHEILVTRFVGIKNLETVQEFLPLNCC